MASIRIPEREYIVLDTASRTRYDFPGFPIGVIPVRELSGKTSPIGIRGDAVKKTVEQSPQVIGNFVRERRQANRLTQRELGELAGVGIRLVSELERGKPTLRMDAVNKVLRVFGQMLGAVEAPRDEVD